MILYHYRFLPLRGSKWEDVILPEGMELPKFKKIEIIDEYNLDSRKTKLVNSMYRNRVAKKFTINKKRVSFPFPCFVDTVEILEKRNNSFCMFVDRGTMGKVNLKEGEEVITLKGHNVKTWDYVLLDKPYEVLRAKDEIIELVEPITKDFKGQCHKLVPKCIDIPGKTASDVKEYLMEGDSLYFWHEEFTNVVLTVEYGEYDT